MKKDLPLLSIISPCYNGEQYLGRFLDSVLCQDYPRIEFILINDGSTDATQRVVDTYTKRLTLALERFIYIRQENAGQAAAINQGLEIFQGDYLTWVDSDDFYPSVDACSKRVEWLQNHPDYGVVCCRAIIVAEKHIEKTIGELRCRKTADHKKFFENLVLGKNSVTTGGVYMVSRKSFLKCIPERKIAVYPGIGQNWQLLLPITYNSKIGFINDVLYTYVYRDNSHSHAYKSREDRLVEVEDRYRALKDILVNIPVEKEYRDKLIRIIKYNRKKELVWLSVQNNWKIPTEQEEQSVCDCAKLEIYRNVLKAKRWIKDRIKRA